MVGFEAMISSQIITLQIKDKSKIDDCQPDVSSATGTPQSVSGKERKNTKPHCAK